MEKELSIFEFNIQDIRAITLAKMLMICEDIRTTKGGLKSSLEPKKGLLKKEKFIQEYNPRDIKKEWYKLWVQNVVSNLRETTPEAANVFADITDSLNITDIKKSLKETKLEDEKKFAILVETIFFTPYLSLGEEKKQSIKNLNKVKLNNHAQKSTLCQIGHMFNINEEEVLDVKKYAGGVQRDLKGFWENIASLFIFGVFGAILLAAFAPVIGAFIGATFLGLNGAAAMTAGLAFLGGGAIIYGGAGMAGGTLVIACGGFLVGAGGAGVVTSSLASLSKSEVVLVSAEIETIIVKYFLHHQKDKKRAVDLYKKTRKTIFEMKELRDSIELEKNFTVEDFLSKEEPFKKQMDSINTAEINMDKIHEGLEEALPIYDELLDRIRNAIKKA